MKTKFVYLFVILIVFYIFNIAVPFHSDDLSWCIDYKGLDVIQFIEKVFACQVNHYFTQNGRIVCHALLQVIVAGGEFFFNVCNTCFFAMSILFTYKYSIGTIRNLQWLPLSIILFSFLYLCPNSESLFYWAAGSLNYLLPTLLTVIVFLLRDYIKKTTNIKFQILALISCFSFVAGWTHEMYVLPVACTMFLSVLYYNKNIDKRLFYLYIPYWFGALLIVFSPGTINRIGTEGDGGNFISLPLYTVIFNKLLVSFKILRDGRMFYVLLFGGIYLYFSKHELFKKYIASNCFLILVLLFSVLMMGTLGVGGRAIWGIEYVSLIIFLRFLKDNTDVFQKQNLVGLVMALAILVHLSLLIKPYFQTWNIYRDAFAQAKSKHFNGTIVIDDWHSDNLIIDNFIAHIYENFQTDMWQRYPLRAEVITPDVYKEIILNENDSTWLSPRLLGDLWIMPYNDLENDKEFIYILKPMQINTHYNKCVSNMWHMLLQFLYPQRYPVNAIVEEHNIAHITVRNKRYIYFRVPLMPVWRNIGRVDMK